MQWLKANKLSLNIKKTELIIFHPKNTKLDYGIKFKLNGRRLTPISTVKCFGILLHEQLSWTKQVSWVNSKLNQTIAILSKLRHNTSLTVLKIVYHSLFGSHLQYGAQLWGQGNCVNQKTYKTFRTEHSGKLLLKNSMILLTLFTGTLKFLNSKISFTFKTVFLYCKLSKIRHLQNLL